jgi:hypothetical protein
VQALQEKLTVFNSTSLALHSTLEALRVAEGKQPRQPLQLLPEMEGKKCEKWSDRKKYEVYNQRRWMMAYCASPAGYESFILREIDRMSPYSKYSREEMYEHYMLKYPSRKILQVEAVLSRGDRLIAEVKQVLKRGPKATS